MFEQLRLIPETDEELIQMFGPFNDVAVELAKVIDPAKYTLNWYQNYHMIRIADVMVKILSLTKDTEKNAVITNYDKNSYHFRNLVEEAQSHNYGLIINQEASTHFCITDYENVTYLTSAEDFLKQSPQHFLRNFTNPSDEKLYVWTNKDLTPMTFFRLLELQGRLFPRENPLADTLIKAFLDKDIQTFKGELIKYLMSDAVLEAEYQNFKTCMASNTNRQIKKLTDNIDSERNNIQYWEQEITSSASKIREWSENIEFLKSRHEDDSDIRLVFKFLKKNPYITSFRSTQSRGMQILLNYEAPIIYFSDYPAEKYINYEHTNRIFKEIIKIFIGRKYELMTKCALYFHTENFRIDIADRELDKTSTAIPHPHLMRFHCFGNHTGAIRDAAESGNYLGAFEQLSQAVMNINFYDSCVINEMVRLLNESKSTMRTWRNKETGEWFTTQEVLERGDYYEEA